MVGCESEDWISAALGGSGVLERMVVRPCCRITIAGFAEFLASPFRVEGFLSCYILSASHSRTS
jgi:hypothetical protein